MSSLVQHALLSLVLFANLCFTGIIFGWASLQLIFEAEHQFGFLCGGSTDVGNTCAAQRNAYNFIYVVGAACVAFCPLPGGVMLDRVGPRKSAVVVGSLMTTGLLLLGLSDSVSFNWFALSYALLGGAGVVNFSISLPISFVYPKEQQPMIHAIMNCLFDASSCIFLIFEQLYFHWGVSRRSFFLVLSGVCVAVYVLIFILWGWVEPMFDQLKGSEKEPLLAHQKEADELESSSASLNRSATYSSEDSIGVSEYVLMQDKPLADQLLSTPFILHAAIITIQLFRANLFMSLNRDLLNQYGDTDKTYVHIYTELLPSTFVIAPLIGRVIKRGGFNNGMMFTTALGVTYGVLACVRILPLQVVTAALFVSFRVFLYSINSAYLSSVFGPRVVGSIMGVMYLFCGFANLFTYPLVAWSNDFGSFFPVNVFLATLGVLIFPLLYRLRVWEKKHLHLLAADQMYPSSSSS